MIDPIVHNSKEEGGSYCWYCGNPVKRDAPLPHTCAHSFHAQLISQLDDLNIHLENITNAVRYK